MKQRGAPVSSDLQEPRGKTPQVVLVYTRLAGGTTTSGQASPPTTWMSYLALLTEDLETGPQREANPKVLGDAVRTFSSLL